MRYFKNVADVNTLLGICTFLRSEDISCTSPLQSLYDLRLKGSNV